MQIASIVDLFFSESELHITYDVITFSPLHYPVIKYTCKYF